MSGTVTELDVAPAGVQCAWVHWVNRRVLMQVSEHKFALGLSVGAFASLTPFIGFRLVRDAAIALVLSGDLDASAVGIWCPGFL